MAGFSREVARRIFSEELKSSNYSFREGEGQHQYAPQYLLTPTGAKCNRVFMVGTLTEKDDIGGDTEYWRGRLIDPTGSILIYAGQYQPEAAQILASIEAPAYVAVVGKPNLYQTEDGNIIISLRAEAISRVDEMTRNQWILDTAERTLERIRSLKGIKPVSVSADFASANQLPGPAPAQDAQRALEHYKTDIEHYRQMVIRALSSLQADLVEGQGTVRAKRPDKPSEENAAAVAVKQDPEAGKTAPVSRKARPKKDESLDAWPAVEGDDEVESIHIGKKS